MTSSATVEGGERQRLFCALTLPDPVLDRLVEWQARELAGLESADGARLNRPTVEKSLQIIRQRLSAPIAPFGRFFQAFHGDRREIARHVRL